jgi:hypothetical protein
MPVLGAAGLLAVASGASAEAPEERPTPNTRLSQQLFLGEEEISDVSLATFYGPPRFVCLGKLVHYAAVLTAALISSSFLIASIL